MLCALKSTRSVCLRKGPVIKGETNGVRWINSGFGDGTITGRATMEHCVLSYIHERMHVSACKAGLNRLRGRTSAKTAVLHETEVAKRRGRDGRSDRRVSCVGEYVPAALYAARRPASYASRVQRRGAGRLVGFEGPYIYHASFRRKRGRAGRAVLTKTVHTCMLHLRRTLPFLWQFPAGNVFE